MDQAQQDRDQIDRARRSLIAWIVHQIEAGQLDDKRLRIFAGALAVLLRIDAAHERTAVMRERIAAQERIARERVAALRERTEVMERIAHERFALQERIADKRNATHLEINRLRAAASLERAELRPSHPQRNEDDPEAPWGRKKDGTPLTHEDFMASLNEAIRDIYGLPPIDPKSYMPDELQKMHERYPDDPRYWSPAQRRRKNNPTAPADPNRDRKRADECAAPIDPTAPPDESNPSKQMNPQSDSPAEIRPDRRDGPVGADWYANLKRSSNAWELM